MRPAWYSASEESLALTRPADVAVVRVRARAFARSAGLDMHEQWHVAIAASEAASNAIKFGAPGWLVMRAMHLPWVGVEIDVRDSGPGFGDPVHALVDGVSEGVMRAQHSQGAWRGLGLGLGAIRRLMDEMSLGRAPSGGARLLARKWSGRAR